MFTRIIQNDNIVEVKYNFLIRRRTSHYTVYFGKKLIRITRLRGEKYSQDELREEKRDININPRGTKIMRR